VVEDAGIDAGEEEAVEVEAVDENMENIEN